MYTEKFECNVLKGTVKFGRYIWSDAKSDGTQNSPAQKNSIKKIIQAGPHLIP